METTERMDMATTVTAVMRPSAVAKGMRARAAQRDERTLEELIGQLRETNSMKVRDSAAQELRKRLKVSVKGMVSEMFQSLTACELEDIVQEALVEFLSEAKSWDWVNEEAKRGGGILNRQAKRVISRMMERQTGRIRPLIPGDLESQKEAKARQMEVARNMVGTSLDARTATDSPAMEIAIVDETDPTRSWMKRESIKQLLSQYVGLENAELVLCHHGEGYQITALAEVEASKSGEQDVQVVAGKLRGRLHRAVKNLRVSTFDADLRELVSIR